jgi:hypothetical protein
MFLAIRDAKVDFAESQVSEMNDILAAPGVDRG